MYGETTRVSNVTTRASSSRAASAGGGVAAPSSPKQIKQALNLPTQPTMPPSTNTKATLSSTPTGRVSTLASPTLSLRTASGVVSPISAPATATLNNSTHSAPTTPNVATATTSSVNQISPSQVQLEKEAQSHQSNASGGSSHSLKKSSRQSSAGSSVNASPTLAPSPSTSSLLPDDWQQDSSVTACHHCGIKFSLLTRKHHCRSCGLIHCDNCSKYRSTIPSKNYHERVRVCGRCYYSLKKTRKSSGAERNSHSMDATTSLNSSTSPPPLPASPPAGTSGGRSKRRAASSDQGERSNNSAANTAAASAAAAVTVAPPSVADVAALERQLTALHSLHSSYEPEHKSLTSLVSNAAALEHTYVHTIQLLYNYLQQQQMTHLNEWKQQQNVIQHQQRHIETLEEILRSNNLHYNSHNYSSGPHGSNSNSSSHGNLISLSRNSRGSSPVPTNMISSSNSFTSNSVSTSSSGVQPPTISNSNRSSSPLMGNMNVAGHVSGSGTTSNPSSRASPSLHAFNAASPRVPALINTNFANANNNPNGTSAAQQHSSSSTNASPVPTGMMHSVPHQILFPALPHAFLSGVAGAAGQSLTSSSSVGSTSMIHPASSPLGSLPPAVFPMSLRPSNPPAHVLHHGATSSTTTTTTTTTNEDDPHHPPLRVSEPPSPPPRPSSTSLSDVSSISGVAEGLASASSNNISAGPPTHRLKRASSNPNASSSSAAVAAALADSNPSTLLDAIGM